MNIFKKLNIKLNSTISWIVTLIFFAVVFYILSVYISTNLTTSKYNNYISDFLKLISIALITSGIVGFLSELASKKAIKSYFDESIVATLKERKRLDEIGIVDVFQNRWKSIDIQENIIKTASEEILIIATTMTSFIGAGLHSSIDSKMSLTKKLAVNILIPSQQNESIKQREILEKIHAEDKSIIKRISTAKDTFSSLFKHEKFDMYLIDNLPIYYFLMGNENELIVAPYGYGVGGNYPVFQLQNKGDKSLYALYWNDAKQLLLISRKIKRNQDV